MTLKIVNGTYGYIQNEPLFSHLDFEVKDVFRLYLLCQNYKSGYSKVEIDNLKVWDYVVSEDPSWLYNEGAGRENALDPGFMDADFSDVDVSYYE